MLPGMPFQRLFATYNRLYGAKEAVLQVEGKPNHLLRVFARHFEPTGGLDGRWLDGPYIRPPCAGRLVRGGRGHLPDGLVLHGPLQPSSPRSAPSRQSSENWIYFF